MQQPVRRRTRAGSRPGRGTAAAPSQRGSSQPSGGSSSPKQSSHVSGSHGLSQSSICGVHIVQASMLASEQSGLVEEDVDWPSTVTVQQPKQSQPFGTTWQIVDALLVCSRQPVAVRCRRCTRSRCRRPGSRGRTSGPSCSRRRPGRSCRRRSSPACTRPCCRPGCRSAKVASSSSQRADALGVVRGRSCRRRRCPCRRRSRRSCRRKRARPRSGRGRSSSAAARSSSSAPRSSSIRRRCRRSRSRRWSAARCPERHACRPRAPGRLRVGRAARVALACNRDEDDQRQRAAGCGRAHGPLRPAPLQLQAQRPPFSWSPGPAARNPRPGRRPPSHSAAGPARPRPARVAWLGQPGPFPRGCSNPTSPRRRLRRSVRARGRPRGRHPRLARQRRSRPLLARSEPRHLFLRMAFWRAFGPEREASLVMALPGCVLYLGGLRLGE